MIFVPQLLDKNCLEKNIYILNNRKHYPSGGVGRTYSKKWR